MGTRVHVCARVRVRVHVWAYAHTYRHACRGCPQMCAHTCKRACVPYETRSLTGTPLPCCAPRQSRFPASPPAGPPTAPPMPLAAGNGALGSPPNWTAPLFPPSTAPGMPCPGLTLPRGGGGGGCCSWDPHQHREGALQLCSVPQFPKAGCPVRQATRVEGNGVTFSLSQTQGPRDPAVGGHHWSWGGGLTGGPRYPSQGCGAKSIMALGTTARPAPPSPSPPSAVCPSSGTPVPCPARGTGSGQPGGLLLLAKRFPVFIAETARGWLLTWANTAPALVCSCYGWKGSTGWGGGL